MNPRTARWAWLLLSLLVVAGACTEAPDATRQGAWLAELDQLEDQNADLTGRLMKLAAGDTRTARLPEGDLVLVVPTAFLENLIERIFTDVASRLELTLSGLHVHKALTVRKGIPLGDMVIDIDIHEVRARLAPGKPEIRFGGNQAELSLPVEVAQGEGDATIHLRWDGRNVAGVVCGDLDVTERVAGSAVPDVYGLAGTLQLTASGTEIVASPAFPETKLKLRIRPSEESWAAIDEILATKTGLCAWVLEKVDVKKIVTKLVEEKGFDVKLPLEKIMPFRFPAGFRESLAVGDQDLALRVSESTVRIDPDAVWAGARVELAPADGG